MRALRRALALAAVSAAFAFSAPAQETITVTLDQARSAAQAAWLNGDIQTANTLAHILVDARPNDTAGLLLLAATEPLLGRPEVGRRAGVKAWASTDNRGLKHEAAYFTSVAAAEEERYTTAQFWLRRAYQTADTEEERDALGETFQRLRAASPWIAQFSFDVSPSSNLNGGASSEFLVIDESYPVGILSGSARALSGVVASAQGTLSYTLSQSADQRTAVSFNGFRTFNFLSEESQEMAPNAQGSDFDYGVAELVFSHRRLETPFFLPDYVAVAFGRTWYGLEPLDKVARLTISKGYELTPSDRLRFTLRGEHRTPEDDAQDRQGRELRLDYYREFFDGYLLALTLAGRNVTSDDPNQAYQAGSFRIAASMVEDLRGFRLSGYFERTAKDYDAFKIGFIDVEEGRHDLVTAASISLHIDRVGYLGFTPVLSLNGSWTDSNISRFESEELGVSLGFQSAF